jgi:S1-C subfamily serine protease
MKGESFIGGSRALLRLAVTAFVLSFLAACGPVIQKGAGYQQFPVMDHSITVLKVDFEQAVDIAYAAAQDAYPDGADVRVAEDGSGVFIDHMDFWAGDARCAIEPMLVQETGTDRSGVFYKTTCIGIGSNRSLAPGYLATAFFKALSKYTAANDIQEVKFLKYKELHEKGIAQLMPASIPVSYAGFKHYIDTHPDRNSHEGIWSDPDGHFTMGIVRVSDDPRFKFYGFIIESSGKNWKPGEIKMKFSDLVDNDVAVGKYLAWSKAAIGVSWSVKENFIEALNSKGKQLFIKVYPKQTEATAEFTGVGTGWAISSDGVFATAAHVVKGAREVFVGFKESPMPARVLIVDERTDLALVQVDSRGKKFVPIPVISHGNIANGTKVVAIGYPMAFTLGDDPRLTEGSVSAQSGIAKDVTRYQVSVPIQPGNSGGPVIDEKGQAVGVAVEKLADANAQVVNFAVKSTYLVSLMEQVGVASDKAAGDSTLSTAAVFAKYKKSVLPVWTR